jgi:hypothetical protein
VTGTMPAEPELLDLRPIENAQEVQRLFALWRGALLADSRFKGGSNRFLPQAVLDKDGPDQPDSEPAPLASGDAEQAISAWRATLRPKGMTASLDFHVKLDYRSKSFTPLDRNNQGAFGRSAEGDTFVLRQWYDSKRIGRRALTTADLTEHGAPPSATLFHDPSRDDAGRGRLYLIVARLTDPPSDIAEQTFAAIAAFHQVAAAAQAKQDA